MKRYAYFPGCSLEKLAQSYHISALETTARIGIDLQELEDWNCCGATTYFHLDQLLAYTLVARNLAQAEGMNLDLVAPCSACYKNAYFTSRYIREDPDLAEHINFALEADGLHFEGNIAVHHLLELFADAEGLAAVQAAVERPLKGLRVAPYYGCQITRPRKNGAPEQDPRFFEDLVSVIGAEPVDFPLKQRCCGATLMMTSRRAALDMVRQLLQNAGDRGADVIATACPLCQVNLECYQTQVNDEFGTDFSFPVAYFTQLVGLALGLPPKRLGLGSEFVSVTPLISDLLQTASA